MQKSLYRITQVSRGFKYNYYFSPPRSSTQPSILFIHGFPSTSYDWHHQVTFFQEKGYGIIVPDMLGYGGTDKPTDPKLYRYDAIGKDLVDILDTEKLSKVIAVGHDWGSAFLSRFLLLHHSRLQAAAFLAVGYLPPDPDYDYDKTMAESKEAFGYELYGYWGLFTSEEGSEICMNHLEAFFNILYPEDSKSWITDMAPSGAMKKSILSGKILPSASWLSSEDKKHQMEAIQSGGLAAPMCYYKASVSGVHKAEDQALPPIPFPTHVPIFFGAASEDFICISAVFKQIFRHIYGDSAASSGTDSGGSEAKSTYTYREFKANHWVMMQVPQKLNKELGEWVKGVEGVS